MAYVYTRTVDDDKIDVTEYDWHGAQIEVQHGGNVSVLSLDRSEVESLLNQLVEAHENYLGIDNGGDETPFTEVLENVAEIQDEWNSPLSYDDDFILDLDDVEVEEPFAGSDPIGTAQAFADETAEVPFGDPGALIEALLTGKVHVVTL